MTADWVEQAACRNVHPDVFFPEKGCESAALNICNRCPVIEPCLNRALRDNETYGVLGGKTPEQRRRIRVARQLEEASR